jgi:hydroxypyruvate reductase
MAAAVEKHWPATASIEGLVITRYGHGAACQRIEVVEAGHPLPDAAGLEASQRMRDIVEGLNADDLVICLLSGGGSALFEVPADGVTPEDTRALTTSLLRSGRRLRRSTACGNTCQQ